MLLASTVYLVAVVILRFVEPETAVAGGFQCARRNMGRGDGVRTSHRVHEILSTL